MLSCQRCGLGSSGPQAFLLTCRGCRKTWHHRCHMPPVEDQDLIRLIRATRSGDTSNDLSTWTCRRCKKHASETPSTTSSREPTASSDSKGLAAGHGHPVADSASLASTADVRVKQESSTTIDARVANNRERYKTSGRQESTEAAPEKRTFSAKRTKPSVTSQPHAHPQPGPTQPGDVDVQMTVVPPTKVTPPDKKKSPQRTPSPAHSNHVKAARKFASAVSEPATSTEDDVEMQAGSPTLPLHATPQVPRSEFVTEAAPHMCAASSTNEREQQARPVAGATIQPQAKRVVADEVDDDPEDLYGPPVERRIIRILPSLAEELREQQRRVAAEKEKRRVPLAPDWMLARHANDPLWKDVPAEGRERRKPIARKLGDNGLNVNELMSCFTVQNWVREYKT